tara:strand:- start:400 stop:798 length:399 start_codon:yes stop_codon:yes gene_type:complete
MKLTQLTQLTPALRGELQPQIVALVGERFWDTPFTEASDQVLVASHQKFRASCVDSTGDIAPGRVSDFITDRMGSPTAITDVGIALAALQLEGISLEAANAEATPQEVRDAQFAAILLNAATTAARAGDGNF